jgi:protein arginine N-methyltransferase 2
MRDLGWYNKPGVKILEGKWQDFIDSEELLAVGGFDVIYTDTFSEDYPCKWNDLHIIKQLIFVVALHQFFGHLPDLLAGTESRFSFFNGLGATSMCRTLMCLPVYLFHLAINY